MLVFWSGLLRRSSGSYRKERLSKERATQAGQWTVSGGGEMWKAKEVEPITHIQIICADKKIKKKNLQKIQ